MRVSNTKKTKWLNFSLTHKTRLKTMRGKSKENALEITSDYIKGWFSSDIMGCIS